MFDVDNFLYWPSGSYYALSYGQDGGATTTCTIGNTICFGGDQPAHDIYWGIGLEANESCTDCCYTCANVSVARTLVCD